MNKKISTIVFLVILLALVGYLAYEKNRAGEEVSVAIPVDTGTQTAGSNGTTTYDWELTAVEAGPGDVPRTAVVLTVDGMLHPIGMYDGNCNVLQEGQTGIGGEQADPNEVARVQCYFAGSGKEIGVFSENGQAVVKVGDLSEGSDDSTPFRGNFKQITTL